MIARPLRNVARVVFKRLQHSAAESASTAKASGFNNKFNFNINPPNVHEYWNYRNASVLLAVIPVYLGVGYVAKYLGANLDGFEGLIEFADNDQLKTLKFGEPQTK